MSIVIKSTIAAKDSANQVLAPFISGVIDTRVFDNRTVVNASDPRVHLIELVVAPECEDKIRSLTLPDGVEIVVGTYEEEFVATRPSE